MPSPLEAGPLIFAMGKKLFFSLAAFLFLFSTTIAEEALLIDDFEGPISEETVDFGTGRGSNLEVLAEKEVKFSGNQSLKIIYDAVSGGYMWIARGYDLDIKVAGAWLALPEDINWRNFNAISFYMYGQNSGNAVTFDTKDNGNEMWRFILKDDFSGWKQVIVRFEEFFARPDWQPQNADKNSSLDFPIKSFQFEPLPEGRGTLYFDCVELMKK